MLILYLLKETVKVKFNSTVSLLEKWAVRKIDFELPDRNASVQRA
ncbi:hypothetical protein CCP3SC1AL1_2110005 [Gammaproteobacteria bacterium]